MVTRKFGGLTGVRNPLAYQTRRLARWCNGSTADSGSVCHGSNPCRAATPICDLRFAICDLRGSCGERLVPLVEDLVGFGQRDALVKGVIPHHPRSDSATGP